MTVRVMCVYFFLSHCNAKTHKEEGGKKSLISCNLVDYSIV